MTKDQTINALWENAGHGTRREDVVAAYEAGVAAERERVETGFTPAILDAIYAAWHGAGVDIAGGNWERFVGMLPIEAIAAIRAKDTP